MGAAAAAPFFVAGMQGTDLFGSHLVQRFVNENLAKRPPDNSLIR
jgi:hypothetical protein